MHSRDLVKSGLDVELVLVPVWHDAGKVFSTRRRGVAWAKQCARFGNRRSRCRLEAAAAEFNDKELADLTYAIGLMNVFNRLGVSFRTPPAATAKANA